MIKFCFDGVDFSRVAIIGSPGSGKTTLSVQLADLLGMQPVHLDKLLWQKGWVLLPAEQRKQTHDNLIAQQQWLIDGMWGSLVADRYDRATVVIHLDYNPLLCLYRAYKRCVRSNGQTRFDMADGCPDKMDKEFVRYILGFRRNMGKKLRLLEQSHSDVVLFKMRTPAQTKRFLQQLQNYIAANNSK